MIPFSTYLSSTYPPGPDLKGTGIYLLPTIYDASHNVLSAPHLPRLRWMTPRGYDDPPFYDPEACDELSAYLVAHGVKEAVLDWEAPDTPGNRAICGRIVYRLRKRRVRLSLYGIEAESPEQADWIARLSWDLHPVWYPYTIDADRWVANRRLRLARLRRRFPGSRIIPWICPVHKASGDGHPVPWGEYVGDDHFRAYLSVCEDADGLCVWPEMGADGNWRTQPETIEPWFPIYSEFAERKRKEV